MMHILTLHLAIENGGTQFVKTFGFGLQFPGGSVGKNPPVNAGDTGDAGLIPGLGRSPGGGNGNPLQYPHLKNPMNRGAWWATVHGVAKSRTRLSTHALTYHYFFFFILLCISKE